jgi:hypothetical protein
VVVLSGNDAAVINNALNYLVNAIPYESSGMDIDEPAARAALRYFHDFPDGTHPVDGQMAKVAEAALGRVLALLGGDPELPTLVADEQDVHALAERFTERRS